MLLLPVPDIDRTHFFLALGANPARLQRQHDDRARHAAPAQGAPRPRWTAGGGRSPAHRDRRGRRHAPLHPAGDGCAPARGAGAHHPRGEAGASRASVRIHRRAGAGPGRGRALRARAGRAGDGHRRRGDPRARPRLRPRRIGGGLRAGGRLHPGLRRRGPVADPGAQRHHRQPRPARRSALHPAGGEPAESRPSGRVRPSP